MYCKIWNPVTESDLKEVDLVPENYMNPNLYIEKYQNDRQALARYLSISVTYEYLAFAYLLKSMDLPDLLGYHWTETWAKDLAGRIEFAEVNEWYRRYYPDFAVMVDGFLMERKSRT